MSPRLQVPDDDARPAAGPAAEEAPQLTHDEMTRERRHGFYAGLLGIVSILLTFAAFPVEASDLPERVGDDSDDRTQLIDVGSGGDGQLLAILLRCASLVLAVAVVWFLYRATKNRNRYTSRWIPIVGTVALVGAAVFLVLGFLEVRDVGREYLASGERSLERAEALFDEARDDGALRWINIGALLTAFLTGIWVSLASLESMRVGLLTRFLGIFGIGTGLATAISFPVGPFLFIGWLGSVAILMLGWWPGGRPPAWEEGRAVGWDEVDAREGRARRARNEGRSL